MKKMLLLTLAAISSGTIYAVPPSVKESIYHGWGEDQLAFREQITLTNDHNYYTITMAQWKPKDKEAPQTQFWLFEPRSYGGFSRPIMDFVRLEVNGISELKLQPEKEDIRIWQKDGLAGVDFTLNYDGAKIVMSWYLRSDSPVLWCTLKPAADKLEPITSAKLKISMVPSKLAKDEKGGVQWNNVYKRQALTPTRLIEQSTDGVQLTEADACLILQDGILDGSNEEKGNGPCIVIPGYENTVSVILDLQNSWLNTLNIQLKPDFKDFKFGLWQQKNPITNAEAAQLVKNAPDQFKIK